MTLYERLGCPELTTTPYWVCREHPSAYSVAKDVVWIDGEFWKIPVDTNEFFETVYLYNRAFQVKPTTKLDYERVH